MSNDEDRRKFNALEHENRLTKVETNQAQWLGLVNTHEIKLNDLIISNAKMSGALTILYILTPILISIGMLIVALYKKGI